MVQRACWRLFPTNEISRDTVTACHLNESSGKEWLCLDSGQCDYQLQALTSWLPSNVHTFTYNFSLSRCTSASFPKPATNQHPWEGQYPPPCSLLVAPLQRSGEPQNTRYRASNKPGYRTDRQIYALLWCQVGDLLSYSIISENFILTLAFVDSSHKYTRQLCAARANHSLATPRYAHGIWWNTVLSLFKRAACWSSCLLGYRFVTHISSMIINDLILIAKELVVNSNKLMLQHTARIDSHLNTPNPLVRNIGHGSPACVVSPWVALVDHKSSAFMLWLEVHVNAASQMPVARNFDLSVSSHHSMEYLSCLRFCMRGTTRAALLVLTCYVWLDFHSWANTTIITWCWWNPSCSQDALMGAELIRYRCRWVPGIPHVNR